MRLNHLAVVAGMITVMLSAAAFAQNTAPNNLYQPASVQRTAYEYDNYLYFAPGEGGSATASDQKAPPAPEQKKAEAAPEAPAEEAAAEEPKAPEPKRLIGNIGQTSINVNGWVDAGGTLNADSPASNYNGPLAPNDRNLLQLNQFYLVMEKKLDTVKNCWDFGGRLDLLYGTDYIYGQSLGLETNPDGSRKWNAGIDYGLIMPQAYVEVGHGDLSLKLGHFYGIIGYESLMATSNFFYSQN
jgi:hypothetical protein